MAEIESIARALLRRGCGVVLFTLGPLGAFAMTNDEPTLKRTLGRIEHGLLPSHVSRRAAFKADGAIDTVAPATRSSRAPWLPCWQGATPNGF